jgi:hypothetical protein
MAKVYGVTIVWLYKGRYEKSIESRHTASSVRAAIGKALSQKREGWRESEGASLKITATVLVTGASKLDALEVE